MRFHDEYAYTKVSIMLNSGQPDNTYTMNGIPIPIISDSAAVIHHTTNASVANLAENVSAQPMAPGTTTRDEIPIPESRDARIDYHVGYCTKSHGKCPNIKRLGRVA